jgi:predicted transcriptional regulator
MPRSGYGTYAPPAVPRQRISPRSPGTTLPRHPHHPYLTFFNWSEMVSALSPKRLELLRHLHAHPEKSVASIAKALGRDYKRVHEDVSTLEHAGLLVREGNLIKAPFDNVQAIVPLG